MVLAHIRQNLRSPLTVEALASVANLSPPNSAVHFRGKPVNHRQRRWNKSGWMRLGL